MIETKQNELSCQVKATFTAQSSMTHKAFTQHNDGFIHGFFPSSVIIIYVCSDEKTYGGEDSM